MTVRRVVGLRIFANFYKNLQKKLVGWADVVQDISTMNVDLVTMDPQNEMYDMYAVDYREQAPNEDSYLEQAYEDRFENACVNDFE